MFRKLSQFHEEKMATLGKKGKLMIITFMFCHHKSHILKYCLKNSTKHWPSSIKTIFLSLLPCVSQLLLLTAFSHLPPPSLSLSPTLLSLPFFPPSLPSSILFSHCPMSLTDLMGTFLMAEVQASKSTVLDLTKLAGIHLEK